MKFKKATQADIRAMRGNAGPVVTKFPAGGGRPRMTIPDRASRSRKKGKGR